jgi:ribosomal protein S18 acetylase RimI-like enzyme
MGRLSHYVFEARSASAVIADLFVHRGNRFSHQFADLAVSAGDVVGVLLSYPGRILNRLDLSTGYRLLRSYGPIPFLRLARRALPLARAREAKADEYYVSALAVSPAFQGQGVGTFLMARAEQLATRLQLPKCALIVDARNLAARRLYERLGYQTVETLNIGQGTPFGAEISHRMVKVLKRVGRSRR